jgi:ribosomal protein S18 acetylase RimI-like enzyme
MAMIVKIQNADEIADFASLLDEIDEIFFESSAKRDFRSRQEKESFREASLGRYIVQHPDTFFVALNNDERPVGYLAGCLENPTKLDHFNDIAYFQLIDDICENYPAHFHVNIAEKYRHRGMGTKLVERFAEWAELNRVQGIHLVTSSTSRSIPFYQKFGFNKLRTFPWNSGTSICMGRKLSHFGEAWGYRSVPGVSR